MPPELTKQLRDALIAKGTSYEPRTRNLHEDGSPIYTNRLLLETSPYLQQHAHNPVNWYPWGDEAFETARRLGRPVMVSIGYSTCHWCHVMEEESFDEPDVAEYLNAHFIAIKVDRESRPDIDSIYMSAVHAMGERGGWPLNVWVTPDRKPFYAGTYFPPRDQRGRRGFPDVLRTISEQWEQERDQVDRYADRLSLAIAERLEGNTATESRVPGVEVLRRAAAIYESNADREWGGLRQRIKFPSSLPVRFLLRYHRRSGDADALAVATLTLEKMAAGGMHDHVGGGFHRYSTDTRWLVPHFEKMLYDNALLALDYLEGGVATGRADFTHVSRRILDYVKREMTSPLGGFYSATDADSETPAGESEEGWFFTWTPDEIAEALNEPQAAAVVAYYGVTASGDYEGRNILHAWRNPAEVAKELEISEAQLEQTLETARQRLYAVRAARPAPLRDDKILVSWNGLMISAFAQAGFALDNDEYVETARRAAGFVLESMRSGKRLQRVYRDGHASGPAFLEDYAFLIAGLMDLYEADPQTRWLREALSLQSVLDDNYADESGGGYFKTANDQQRLIAREKPSSDGALPSGNAVALRNLLRLAEFTGDDAHRDRAVLAFSAFSDALSNSPSGLSEMLLALDYEHDAAPEIVLVQSEPGTAEDMLRVMRSVHLPNRVLALVTESEASEELETLVPLVAAKRSRAGKATAYVCENRVCQFPTADPKAFEAQLRRIKPIP
jgi:hypothetical protein